MFCPLSPSIWVEMLLFIYMYIFFFFFLYIIYWDGTIEDCTFPSLRLPCLAHWDPASLCGEPIPGELFTSLLRLLKHSYHRNQRRRWETAQVLIRCCLERPNNRYRRLVEGLEMFGVTGADCHLWPPIFMCLHVSSSGGGHLFPCGCLCLWQGRCGHNLRCVPSVWHWSDAQPTQMAA